jgi:two-component system, sensor histidine kinase LadS
MAYALFHMICPSPRSHSVLGGGIWSARLKQLIVVILLLLSIPNARAVLDVSESLLAYVPLSGHMAFMEDSGGTLTLANVENKSNALKFQPANPQAYALQLGYTRSPWWLRFSLRNATDQPVLRYVEIASSRLTRLSFYEHEIDGGTRVINTGSLLNFSSRPYPNRNFVFPVTVPPRSSSTYYFRVESSSALSVPARLWTPEGFRAHEKTDYLVQGSYVGIAIAMGLFNLFLFFALRQKLYLIYVSAMTCIAFTACSHNGLVKEFITADSPSWSLSSASVGYVLSVGLLLMFMREMLCTSKVLPLIDRWLRLMMWVYLIPIPVVLALFHEISIYWTQYLTLAVIVIQLMVLLYLCWLRLRSACYFLLAYATLIFVACLNALAALGVVPLNWDIGYSGQTASALEMLLLALALADRMNQMRRERDHSQQLASDLQNRLLEELRGSEQRLKQLVSQRVDELRRLIDMLSHEIRTPMSVIRMFFSIDFPSERNKTQAQQALHDVDAIIERCIEVDRIDHGAVAIRLERCRVDELVHWLCAVNPEAERIVIEAAQHCEINSDLQLLKILLSNLIDNALKYSLPGSTVRIAIESAEIDNRPGMQMRISNCVDPVGLPDPARVFQKFYRSPAAHGKSGSGLGLYLVRHFAHLLGGSLEYRPGADGWVSFELWMPY